MHVCGLCIRPVGKVQHVFVFAAKELGNMNVGKACTLRT